MTVLVKLTTPSSNWHEGAMTVEVEAKSVNQAFELKKRWAELCAELDHRENTRPSGRSYSSRSKDSGPTSKQWLFLIDLAKQAGASEENAPSFVYKTATEAGVKSLKTSDQGGIDKVIQALKAKANKDSNSPAAPLFDSTETKELVDDDPFD